MMHSKETFAMPSHAVPARQAGFTLIEIMVVIFIIGLLVAIVAPNVLDNQDKAMQQKARADLASLEQALDMYRLDNLRYPTAEQGLAALVSKPTQAPEPRNYRADGYIRRLPEDPWGAAYRYRIPGEHGRVDLYSLGADGREGGEGSDADIGNWTESLGLASLFVEGALVALAGSVRLTRMAVRSRADMLERTQPVPGAVERRSATIA
jgi:general secretion pathway protein G